MGFNIKTQALKAWVGGTVRRQETDIRLLTCSIALLNKQLKLEDKKKEKKKTLHVSTPANQYSTGCCARLRRKRAGDELDSSSEAGPLQGRKSALREGRIKRAPGSVAN